MDRYIDLSVISILRYKLILKFFWRLRKMRYICSVLHIQRQTEACFILKSGIFNACKVRCTKIQRLFNPVLLLNGVATAFEVCRTTGHGQPFLSYNANKSFHKMADIKIFDNPQFGKIRTAGTSDEPFFCLADICRVLEIKNVSDCKSRLDQKGIVLTDTPTSGGIQPLVYINEKNLYKVIMRSDKPQAEPFQDWVCGEVLPSIRKTGSYSITQILSPSELILRLAQKNVDNERKMREIEDKQERLQSEIDDIRQRTTTDLGRSTIVAYVSRNNIKLDVKRFGAMGRKASTLCKKRDIPVTKIHDVRWGQVSVFPDEILDEVFADNEKKN